MTTNRSTGTPDGSSRLPQPIRKESSVNLLEKRPTTPEKAQGNEGPISPIRRSISHQSLSIQSRTPTSRIPLPVSPTLSSSRLPLPSSSRSSPLNSPLMKDASTTEHTNHIGLRQADLASSISATNALKTLQALPRFKCRSVIQAHHGDKGVRCMITVKDKMWGASRDGFSIDLRLIKNGQFVRKLLHPDEGKPRKVPTEKPRLDIVSLTLSVNETIVWSGGLDGLIRLWEVESGNHLKWFKAHTGSVEYITRGADGNMWSASTDFTIKQWHGRSHFLVLTLMGHSNWVRTLVPVIETGQLWSGSDDGTIRIWDAKSGEAQSLIDVHEGVLSMLRVENTIWAGLRDKTIKVYNPKTRELIKTLPGHKGWVNCLALVGQHVWSGSADRTLCVWDTQNLEPLQKIEGFRGWMYSIAAAENVLWASCSDQKIRVYGVTNPRSGVPSPPQPAAVVALSPTFNKESDESDHTKMRDASVQTEWLVRIVGDGIADTDEEEPSLLWSDAASISSEQATESDDQDDFLNQLENELTLKNQQLALLHQTLEEKATELDKLTALSKDHQNQNRALADQLTLLSTQCKAITAAKEKAEFEAERLMDQLAMMHHEQNSLAHVAIQTDEVLPQHKNLEISIASTVDIYNIDFEAKEAIATQTDKTELKFGQVQTQSPSDFLQHVSTQTQPPQLQESQQQMVILPPTAMTENTTQTEIAMINAPSEHQEVQTDAYQTEQAAVQTELMVAESETQTEPLTYDDQDVQTDALVPEVKMDLVHQEAQTDAVYQEEEETQTDLSSSHTLESETQTDSTPIVCETVTQTDSSLSEIKDQAAQTDVPCLSSEETQTDIHLHLDQQTQTDITAQSQDVEVQASVDLNEVEIQTDVVLIGQTTQTDQLSFDENGVFSETSSLHSHDSSSSTTEEHLLLTCTVCYAKVAYENLPAHSKTCALREAELKGPLARSEKQKAEGRKLDEKQEEFERINKELRESITDIENKLRDNDPNVDKHALMRRLLSLKDKLIANLIAQKVNAMMRAASYSNQAGIAKREVSRLNAVIYAQKLEEQFETDEDIARAMLGSDLSIDKLQQRKDNHIIKMAGWLLKRSEHIKQWNRRFCVLIDKYFLYYVAKKHNQQPRGVFVLNNVTVNRLAENVVSKAFAFRISSPKHDYQLAGLTDGERNRWMAAVESASNWWSSSNAYSEALLAAEMMGPQMDAQVSDNEEDQEGFEAFS